MLRSVLAVLAGFIAWSIGWLAGNVAVMAALPDAFGDDGASRDPVALGIALALSVALSVGAGWLTALIARRRPLAHGVVQGIALLVVGIGVQASVWTLMPAWFHLSFLVLLVPAAALGGVLRAPRATTLATT